MTPPPHFMKLSFMGFRGKPGQPFLEKVGRKEVVG